MNIRQLLTAWLILSSWCWLANAQTTAFTYQGKLTESNLPANAAYDFQFKLFDALSGGTQVSATFPVNGVAVSGGVFTVTLDFGANAFPSAARFLEISVRQAGLGAFITLNPRQPVTVVPYAIKSLGATAADGLTSACVGCVTGAQIGSLPASSGSYIQNQNAAPQAGSNFNIEGDGTAGGTLAADTVNAATQYNLGGNRILSTAGMNNLFVGINTGAANTFGNANAFFGRNAGQANTEGSNNGFFGTSAGTMNTTGYENAFFGRSAGQSNTAGYSNTFFGAFAGFANTIGNNNTIIGANAGPSNTPTSNNTALGAQADVIGFGYGTAIGAGAVLIGSNRVQLGRAVLDDVAIGRLSPIATNSPVCFRNEGGTVIFAFCGSSQRYKDNLQPLGLGLRLIQQLRPVTFTWKDSHQPDLGLIAEEVAAVEPLLNTYNNKGELEGVKYTQLTVVLINAVKEQQTQLETQAKQIAAQQAQLKQQQQQLDALRKLVCQTQPQAAACQE